LRAPTPAVRDLVLLGGGHSHVEVLRAFAMRPLAGVRLTLVAREILTPYSGMLPGVVAGHYSDRAAHIDLAPLAQRAGARLIEDEVTGLDLAATSQISSRQAGYVHLAEHPELRFDLLSINTGAVPVQPAPVGIAVKPIGRFLPHWRQLQAAIAPGARIAVVGGGAGGIELALAIRHALPVTVAVLLFAESLLAEASAGMRRRAAGALAQAGISVTTGFRVVAADAGQIQAADGRIAAVDHVIWVTRADAPDWLAESGLAVDRGGFMRVDRTLRSINQPAVFGAGDVVSLEGQARPKSGVYAVRAGPVLAANLRRTFMQLPLQSYRAQRRALVLMGTGGAHALAARGRWAGGGAWAWRLKRLIDERFIARYQMDPSLDRRNRMREPMPVPALQASLPDAERCGGCAAKMGADPLRRVLARLPSQARSDIAIGIGDDAAVLELPAGPLLLTVDGFRSLIDDPYRFGRIVAHHSLNDVLAMGGRPRAALALATVPLMAEVMMEDELYWLLRGAVDVLNEHGVALVGGHSTEGAELSLGLTITGQAGPTLLTKAGLRAGDALILTKPLGTGVLLAAAMQGRARGDAVAHAVRVMDTSNERALSILNRYQPSALTDVTGFGLLGHLAEMLRAGGVGATVMADQVPLLDGALETVIAGVRSSLHASNVGVLEAYVSAEHPAVPLLVDPQTSGGLLAGIPAHAAEACITALRAAGYSQAAHIGWVTAAGWTIE
jgi:selenide,water dikinase